MNRKYFTGIKTKSELRKAYIKLMKQYHPDNGGSTEICKEINAEYEYLSAKLPDIDMTQDEQYKDYSDSWKEKQREAATKSAADLDLKLREMICRIIGLNIDIEVVGCWIWLSGNTYAYREQIKAAGYMWSKGRKKWYACPYYEIDKNNRHYHKDSFQTLRNKYGSDKITNPDLLDD